MRSRRPASLGPSYALASSGSTSRRALSAALEDRRSGGADRAVSRVDVVVLRDGPARSVAALTLAESGARVALLGMRHRRAAAARAGQCLPAQGWTWMRALGLADAFRAGPHLPILANRSAWSSAEIAAEDLIRGPHGPSWLLDRDAFDALLRAAAVSQGAAAWVARGRIEIEAVSDGWRFRLQDGEGAERVIEAGFAIDASGRGPGAEKRCQAVHP